MSDEIAEIIQGLKKKPFMRSHSKSLMVRLITNPLPLDMSCRRWRNWWPRLPAVFKALILRGLTVISPSKF